MALESEHVIIVELSEYDRQLLREIAEKIGSAKPSHIVYTGRLGEPLTKDEATKIAGWDTGA